MTRSVAQHRFLQSEPSLPPTEQVSELCAAILNRSFRAQLSAGQYRKQGVLALEWQNESGPIHKPRLRFKDLVNAARISRSFPFADFDLPRPLSPWLDSSIWITKPDGPIISTAGDQYLPFEAGMPFGRS